MSKINLYLLTNSLQLPSFRNIYELSELIGLSTKLLYCLSKNAKSYYNCFKIPKKNGTYREIASPTYTMYIVQKWILKNILNKILPTDRAMAFRTGDNYGYKSNAIYHKDTLYGLTIDLKDFFTSIKSDKVYTIFRCLGYNKLASTILTNICTLNGCLPQGGVCSPSLSNLICISLDNRLIGLCEKREIRYTRYADDMYFSCDNKYSLLRIKPIIIKIINDENFIINYRKTHFQTPKNRKLITGIVINYNSKQNIYELKANKEKKLLVRAEIFRSIITGSYENREHILGVISYINYVENKGNNEYIEHIKKYIQNTAEKISIFEELVKLYNENLFYKDLPVIKPNDLLNDYEIAYIIQDRKKYMSKNNLIDICNYDKFNINNFSNDEFNINKLSNDELPF